MDQNMVNIAVLIVGIACACLGWFANVLWQGQKDIRTDLTALQVKMAEQYVHKDTLKDIMDEIRSTVNNIYKKLDDKQEKH